MREYDIEIFDDEKVETRLETFFVFLNLLRDGNTVTDATLGRSTASIVIMDINSKGYL